MSWHWFDVAFTAPFCFTSGEAIAFLLRMQFICTCKPLQDISIILKSTFWRRNWNTVCLPRPYTPPPTSATPQWLPAVPQRNISTTHYTGRYELVEIARFAQLTSLETGTVQGILLETALPTCNVLGIQFQYFLFSRFMYHSSRHCAL